MPDATNPAEIQENAPLAAASQEPSPIIIEGWPIHMTRSAAKPAATSGLGDSQVKPSAAAAKVLPGQPVSSAGSDASTTTIVPKNSTPLTPADAQTIKFRQDVISYSVYINSEIATFKQEYANKTPIASVLQNFDNLETQVQNISTSKIQADLKTLDPTDPNYQQVVTAEQSILSAPYSVQAFKAIYAYDAAMTATAGSQPDSQSNLIAIARNAMSLAGQDPTGQVKASFAPIVEKYENQYAKITGTNSSDATAPGSPGAAAEQTQTVLDPQITKLIDAATAGAPAEKALEAQLWGDPADPKNDNAINYFKVKGLLDGNLSSDLTNYSNDQKANFVKALALGPTTGQDAGQWINGLVTSIDPQSKNTNLKADASALEQLAGANTGIAVQWYLAQQPGSDACDALYKKAIEADSANNPNDAKTYWTLAQNYPVEAVSLSQVAQDPSVQRIDAKMTGDYQTLYTLASQAQKSGDLKSAVGLYNDAISTADAFYAANQLKAKQDLATQVGSLNPGGSALSLDQTISLSQSAAADLNALTDPMDMRVQATQNVMEALQNNPDLAKSDASGSGYQKQLGQWLKEATSLGQNIDTADIQKVSQALSLALTQAKGATADQVKQANEVIGDLSGTKNSDGTSSQGITDLPAWAKQLEAALSGSQQSDGADQAALEKAVPGLAALDKANSIMSDSSLSPEQKLAKASPYFQQAIDASKTIDLNDTDNKLADVASKLQPVIDKANKMTQAQIQADSQLQQQYQTLNSQQQTLAALRMEPLNALTQYAQALNQTAVTLSQEKVDAPGKQAQNKATAQQLNNQAVSVLNQISQIDPNLGGQANPSQYTQLQINGAIAEAKAGQLINLQKAEALGIGQDVSSQMMSVTNGRLGRGLQPVLTELNFFNKGSDVIGEIPVLGIGAKWMGGTIDISKIPDFEAQLGNPMDPTLAAYFQTPSSLAPVLTTELAQEKVDDPKTAKATIDQTRHKLLNQASNTTSSIASGLGAVGAAEALTAKALALIGQDAPNPLVKGAAYLSLGALAAAGIKESLDYGSHEVLGTDQHSVAQNLAAAEAAFGATLAFHKTAPTLGRFLGDNPAALDGDADLAMSNPKKTGWLSAFGAKSMARGEKPGWLRAGIGYGLSGGISYSIYGLGETNPLYVNPDTGRNYTMGNTFSQAGDNFLTGFAVSGALSFVSPKAEAWTKFGIEAPFKMASWLANKDAQVIQPGNWSWNPLRSGATLFDTVRAPIQSGRRALGTAVSNKVNDIAGDGTILGNIGNQTKFVFDQASTAVKPSFSLARKYVYAMSLPLSNAAGASYGLHKWDQINTDSDQQAQVIKKQQEAQDAQNQQ